LVTPVHIADKAAKTPEELSQSIYYLHAQAITADRTSPAIIGVGT